MDVAAISINLLDIMGIKDAEAITKMHDLARWLVSRICDAAIKQARQDGVDIRHIETNYDPEADKNTLLGHLANCLRAMAKPGCPVEIYDTNGVLR